MPAKRPSPATAAAAAGALASSRRVRVRLRVCLRLAASLSFLLLLAALLRTQPAPPEAALPPSAGPAKVAFLFLVRAGVPLDFLWDALFRNGEEGKFSVYVHSAPGYVLDWSTTRSAHFHGRQLSRSVKVAWGEATMIEAERLLFAAALGDPANQRFVLLSDSCVPLYNFSYIYTYLMTSPKSFVDSFLDKTEKRYNPNMSPAIPKEKWRKGSQWVALIRKHAEVVIGNKHVFSVFRRHCKIVLKHGFGRKPAFRRLGFELRRKQIMKGAARKEHDCIPDEHYVQTLFSIEGLENELERRTLTYTSWNQSSDHMNKMTWHPMTFEYDTSSPEHMNVIRSINHVNYEMEYRTEWCQCNGTSAPCFLFARKFSHGAAMRVLDEGVLGPLKSAALPVNFDRNTI